MAKQHYLELLADKLYEAYELRVDELVNWLTVDGRPVFSRKLSNAERLDDWRDEAKRALIEKQLFEEGGVDAVSGYEHEMNTLELKQLKGLGLISEEDANAAT